MQIRFLFYRYQFQVGRWRRKEEVLGDSSRKEEEEEEKEKEEEEEEEGEEEEEDEEEEEVPANEAGGFCVNEDKGREFNAFSNCSSSLPLLSGL